MPSERPTSPSQLTPSARPEPPCRPPGGPRSPYDRTRDGRGHPPALFALFDELARGLAREAALDPTTRAARTPQILAWFAPRYVRLQAEARARPCPLPWRLNLPSGIVTPPPPIPHPCPDCFTARYEAWKAARGLATPAPAEAAESR